MRAPRAMQPNGGGRKTVTGVTKKPGSAAKSEASKACADLVRLYLTTYRHRLGPDDGWLFPSTLPGRPKRADTLGKQLTRLVRKSLGFEVNPHLYRHIVHVVALNQYPGAYAMVSRILGHRSLQTAITNYASEDIAIAMRAFQGLVGDVMSGKVAEPLDNRIATGLTPWSLTEKR